MFIPLGYLVIGIILISVGATLKVPILVYISGGFIGLGACMTVWDIYQNCRYWNDANRPAPVEPHIVYYNPSFQGFGLRTAHIQFTSNNHPHRR
jgi:hypothetical protein